MKKKPVKIKLKTRNSVKKRFKLTKTGKLLRRQSGLRHLRRKKKKSRIRAGKVPQEMTGRWKKKIKKVLGKG
ncbi:MAG: 50S ribosomal protein L35 [Candidatus Pacebacteria bacterium]|nr:50S ribosomal protein L35 [Candidatus Paceibacterota bacterium]